CFQAEGGIRGLTVTGVQTCALPIFIFNVHPAMAVNPMAPTTREPFAPGALYEIKVDTDGDAIADVCFSLQFATSQGGTQTATLQIGRASCRAGLESSARARRVSRGK